MYSVEVRDRIMIAHSLPDPFFGPAQHMHGATFVVDVAFFRSELTPQNVVVDIGAALDVLNKTLKPLAYKNLDELPQFKGKLTTTEFLCRHVFDRMAEAARTGALGADGRATTVVLRVGGLAGVGAKLVAMPYSALKIGPVVEGGRVLLIDVSKEQLQAAPTYVATDPSSVDRAKKKASDWLKIAKDKAVELGKQAGDAVQGMREKAATPAPAPAPK